MMLTRQEAKRVALTFLLWRGLFFVSLFIARSMTAQRTPNPNKDFVAFPSHWFWDSFARWDSGWYARIVERGYYFEGAQSDVVFFPLYPYLTRALAFVIGNHWVAGLLVSNAALLGACAFVFAIARTLGDEADAERAITYVLLFPTSFFFSAYYTEALFLLTTSAAFYFYLHTRYGFAVVMGAFAAATRSTGIALAVAFAVGQPKKSPWFVGIGAGVLAFMLILWMQVGDPWAFVHGQSGWSRHLTFPLQPLWEALLTVDWSFPRDEQNTELCLGLLTALAFLALPLLLKSPSLSSYGVLLVLVPLSSGSLQSMTRFAAVSFPAFIALARLGRSPRVDRAIMVGFALLLMVLSTRFASWFWAG